MVINFDDINRIVLRQTFLPWFKREMALLGITLPADWDPSDEELGRLADRVSEAFRDPDADPSET